MRAIAARVGVSYATVQHWLSKHGLKTKRAAQPRGADARTVQRECPVHGLTTFVRYSANDHHRCERCRKDRVVARRRKVKALLVEEAGGCCLLCGYDRYSGALQFIISTRARSRSDWGSAASRAHSNAAGRRRASAFSCARTATRRLKRASQASDNSYYGRRAAHTG